MIVERRADAVLAWAPAKVNLYLEVLGKRPDGYHELETLMVSVSLYDTLEFKEGPSPRIQLSCDHPSLSCGSDNLVWRAAALLQAKTGCQRGATIHLKKRIPLQAGLAGGSTDAAATLVGLNHLWELGLDAGQLAELAGELGSDVAFFLSTPAAWCTGRGERVRPVALGVKLWFVLACPPFGLSTPEVFRALRDLGTPREGSPALAALESGRTRELGSLLHNRLQAAAEAVRPELAGIREQIERLRPVGCLMSGSGSTLFALCADSDEALRIAQGLSTGLEENAVLGVHRSRPIVLIVQSSS